MNLKEIAYWLEKVANQQDIDELMPLAAELRSCDDELGIFKRDLAVATIAMPEDSTSEDRLDWLCRRSCDVSVLVDALRAKLADCREDGDCADAALQQFEYCSNECSAMAKALDAFNKAAPPEPLTQLCMACMGTGRMPVPGGRKMNDGTPEMMDCLGCAAAPPDSAGMQMSDVHVGMRLRSVLEMDRGGPREFVTVTALTDRGFKYSLGEDIPLGARYGVELKDNHEHFGMSGYAFYELAAPQPAEPAPSRNYEALRSFAKFCNDHPTHRFWQALRNWSNFGFILGANTRDGATLDTFNLEGLDGIRQDGSVAEPAEPARDWRVQFLSSVTHKHEIHYCLSEVEARSCCGDDPSLPSARLQFSEDSGKTWVDADAPVKTSYAVCNSPGCLLPKEHNGDCIDSRPVEGGKP